jgi:acetoin utilization deacetylase AcuC-like enzyme
MPAVKPVVYSRSYEIDLGGHIWPIAKYRLIAAELVARGLCSDDGFVRPEPCSWEDLALVHTPEYLRKVREGLLTAEELRTLELPWVPGLADGFRLMTGGTLQTAATALERGVAVHLGGGFHHAYPNHGEGFCLFNDIAVAVRVLQQQRRAARAAVVDVDVHHGNGTAFIFAEDPSVFTFSIHQQHNYPFYKPPSDLDIGLPDGTTDAEYLEKMAEGLRTVLASRPDLIVYVAGSDPFDDDRLGGLALSIDGLRDRDRLLFETAREAGVPVAVVLAGGYAWRIEDTVAIHVHTVVEAFKSA